MHVMINLNNLIAGNIARLVTHIRLMTFPRTFTSTFLPCGKRSLILNLVFLPLALAISFAPANLLLSKLLGHLARPPLVLAISFTIKY